MFMSSGKLIRYAFCIIFLLFSCNKIQERSKPEDEYFNVSQSLDFDYISSTQGILCNIKPLRHFYNNIDSIPALSNSINNALLSSVRNFSEINHYSFRLLGFSAGGFGPLIIPTNHLKIENEYDLKNTILEKHLWFHINDYNEWNKLPFQFRKKIIELYLILDISIPILNNLNQPFIEYLNSKSIKGIQETYVEIMNPFISKEITDFGVLNLLNQYDLRKLSFASRLISHEINDFQKWKKFEFSHDFNKCKIRTKYGDILINGTKTDTTINNSLIIIDLGGDDYYSGNIASPVTQEIPVSIVIDFKGDDLYDSKSNFIACGILGIAALIDLGGNDQYSSGSPGMAFSLFGASILFDYDGDDFYEAYSSYSQASALFIYQTGIDSYSCMSYSQGFGGTMGVGLFLDTKGHDTYNHIKSEINSNELPSFVQGSAKGRWAEATDGHSLSGGIGVFIDNLGNDIYNSATFSQGASYYFGLGLFRDNSGDDEYNAISHSQGYAAHFSLASFNESDGDDVYNSKSNKSEITQIIGSGRDFSAGVFIDHNGNDQYSFGNRSLGISDMSGIGVMIDKKGNDQYFYYKNQIYATSGSYGKSFPISKTLKDSRIYIIKDISEAIFKDTNGNNSFKVFPIN